MPDKHLFGLIVGHEVQLMRCLLNEPEHCFLELWGDGRLFKTHKAPLVDVLTDEYMPEFLLDSLFKLGVTGKTSNNSVHMQSPIIWGSTKEGDLFDALHNEQYDDVGTCWFIKKEDFQVINLVVSEDYPIYVGCRHSVTCFSTDKSVVVDTGMQGIRCLPLGYNTIPVLPSDIKRRKHKMRRQPHYTLQHGSVLDSGVIYDAYCCHCNKFVRNLQGVCPTCRELAELF